MLITYVKLFFLINLCWLFKKGIEKMLHLVPKHYTWDLDRFLESNSIESLVDSNLDFGKLKFCFEIC